MVVPGNAFAILKEEAKILRRKERLAKQAAEEEKRREKWMQMNHGQASWADISDDDDCFYDASERENMKRRQKPAIVNTKGDEGSHSESDAISSDDDEEDAADTNSHTNSQNIENGVHLSPHPTVSSTPQTGEATVAAISITNLSRKERLEVRKKEMQELEAMLSEFGMETVQLSPSLLPEAKEPIPEIAPLGDVLKSEIGGNASVVKKKKKKSTTCTGTENSTAPDEEPKTDSKESESALDKEMAIAKAKLRLVSRKPKNTSSVAEDAVKAAAEEAANKKKLQKKEKKEKLYFPQRQ